MKIDKKLLLLITLYLVGWLAGFGTAVMVL